MPLARKDFEVQGGLLYAHLFENRSTGLPRSLYWSATANFRDIAYLGENWTSSLTIEWLKLDIRTVAGTWKCTANPVIHPVGEASLYLVEHFQIKNWSCVLGSGSSLWAVDFEFDVTLDFPGLNHDPVTGLRLTGHTTLDFEGLVVVPGNLSPKPDSPEDTIKLIGPYFDIDATYLCVHEGWRYVFKPQA